MLLAIGLFDVQGGADINPDYELTSPIFDRIVIKLDQKYYPGKSITINCSNNSRDNVYIQSVRWNGKQWDKFNIPHNDLVNGGELDIVLGPEPNYSWGY